MDSFNEYKNSIENSLLVKKQIKDKLFWEEIKSYDTQNMYQVYIQKYPNGIYKEIAQQKIDDFRVLETNNADITAWKIAEKYNSKESYSAYLNEYHNGIHANEAKNRIDKIIYLEKEDLLSKQMDKQYSYGDKIKLLKQILENSLLDQINYYSKKYNNEANDNQKLENADKKINIFNTNIKNIESILSTKLNKIDQLKYKASKATFFQSFGIANEQQSLMQEIKKLELEKSEQEKLKLFQEQEKRRIKKIKSLTDSKLEIIEKNFPPLIKKILENKKNAEELKIQLDYGQNVHINSIQTCVNLNIKYTIEFKNLGSF